MENIRETIADNISALRNEKKMTQLELAEILNYSDKAVSKWERGESIPDVITLKAIADLFGVTVDYIITPHHPDEKRKGSETARNNKIIITLISVVGVWILGTIVYVVSDIVATGIWMSFVVCLPVSFVVLMIFNSIWGKPRLNLLCISAVMWSCLLTIYLICLVYCKANLWVLFLIGIPAQVALSLGLGIRKPKDKSKKEVMKLVNINKRKKKAPEDNDGSTASNE